MKFPSLHAAFLLLVIISILAGCSSPSVPGSKTPSSGVLSVTAGTPIQYTDLSQLVLLRSEIPFTVVDEKSQVPDLANPAFSRFGAIRGYTRFTINETSESSTSVQFGQTIVEYPPGNATLAFADFINQNRNADQTQYNISLYQLSGIGDRSAGLLIYDKTGATKPRAMIVFVKSNIMESVVLIAPRPDLDGLTRAAKLAAAKIP